MSLATPGPHERSTVPAGELSPIRIIVVGGAGAIGTPVVEHLSAQHEVVVAGRQSGQVTVDIASADSVRSMFQEVGSFEAVVCTAGEAHFGPFATMDEEALALGVHRSTPVACPFR